MTKNVFAGTWEIAAKSGMNKSIARFPDVCLSPPSPPAGPIPVPYPDTSFSTDLKEGSKSVKIGGQAVALAQQSFYKPSILGNEAATRTFGASVITHQITGKTEFQAWCFDVKVEGKNVCRHFDITTSNHSSPPPATPPMPSAEMQAMPAADAIAAGKCPCCGEPLHPWQKDEAGNALKPISEEDYWRKKIAKKEKALNDKLATLTSKSKARQRAAVEAQINALAGPKAKVTQLMAMKDASRQKVRAAQAGGASPQEAAQSGCLNVNPEDGQGCGTYFDTVDVEYSGSLVVGHKPIKTPSQLANLDFTSTQYARLIGRPETPTPKDKAIRMWEDNNPGRTVDPSTKMDHKTPKQAGGCNSAYNTAPRDWYSDPSDPSDPCAQIEQIQSQLEDIQM